MRNEQHLNGWIDEDVGAVDETGAVWVEQALVRPDGILIMLDADMTDECSADALVPFLVDGLGLPNN